MDNDSIFAAILGVTFGMIAVAGDGYAPYVFITCTALIKTVISAVHIHRKANEFEYRRKMRKTFIESLVMLQQQL
jgi:hypothetical protein